MSRRAETSTATQGGTWRLSVVILGFVLLAAVLVARASYLQLLEYEFYRGQGEARQLRTVAIPAHRGDLLDRNGEPLAISTPIESLWGVPQALSKQPQTIAQIAGILDLDADALMQRISVAAQRGRQFIYLKRHVLPETVAQVMQLDISDVSVQQEYRRFYPSGAATSHLLGFTDIDDRGREGLEMAYEGWLSGSNGSRRVIRDRTGREIAGMGVVQPAQAGKDLKLSVDRQLQYFADKALRDAISRHQAESGSVVVMDVDTGEIMAMVNYPAYNPNDRADRSGARLRNRAITDVFEPGSTMKPFTVAAALDSGRFSTDSRVDTSPGRYRIGEYEISDIRNYGWLDLGGIVTQSSNVGISKLARQLDPEKMWSVFDAFGFGRPTGSEFPGEVAGYFNHPAVWHRSEQASVSFGYGISVSALQLVSAYAALASDGMMPAISFIANPEPDGRQRVIDEAVVKQLQPMLESVVTSGSGKRANVPGYRVAGKTGTSHRSQSGGYSEDRYISLFAGYAPASNPRYAMVVVIHDPTAGEYFGGVVAAPVFADVMGHALRLGAVEPDATDSRRALVPVLPAAVLSPASGTVGDRS